MVTIALLLLAQPFAGSKACAGCHTAIFEKQSQTNHARALLKQQGARFAFGSGAQATTYVARAAGKDEYVEESLSWYRRTQALARTPGHTDDAGVRYRTFAADSAILRCFQCHSTGELKLSAGREIEPAELGVRCENCHGAAGEHVVAPAKGNISNPKRLDGAEVNSLCGQCHRMPPARGVATDFENPWNVRHQPVYFSQSQCFLKSAGKLSCLSCHDPHEDGLTQGDSKCAQCHAAPKHVAAAKGSCVGCHMPKVQPSPLLQFTNHWIGVYGASKQRPRRVSLTGAP